MIMEIAMQQQSLRTKATFFGLPKPLHGGTV